MTARHAFRRRRSGQSIIESCVVIAVVCLIFFGLFQVSQLYAARAVLGYAAAAGARARMVGFNDFMAYKVVQAAAIPNAGLMVVPDPPGFAGGLDWGTARPGAALAFAMGAGVPTSEQLEIERSRIPNYLYTTRWGEMTGVLDYERWRDIRYFEDSSPDTILLATYQQYPLLMPFTRTFYAADSVRLESDGGGMYDFIVREAHHPLYLEE